MNVCLEKDNELLIETNPTTLDGLHYSDSKTDGHVNSYFLRTKVFRFTSSIPTVGGPVETCVSSVYLVVTPNLTQNLGR